MGTRAAALTDEELLMALRAAAEGIHSELGGLSEDSVTAPSELPGWTRGHVLAHIEGIASALARQAELARRHRQADLYDGGLPARDRAIEAGAHAAAGVHRKRVGASVDRALAAFEVLSPEEWDTPVRFRDGVVRDAALALWRELVIHRGDLGTGCTQQEWSGAFCRHLLGFLAPRVPEGRTFDLCATGGEEISLGGGSDVVVLEGRLQDLAAWLAGRSVSHGAVRATHAGEAVPLPGLGPWPSAIPTK
ncbi:maleylpyruvate isomerase family mycothiol-dependent enzyme [Sinomonas notoginsengisoli]|uniref:maleylpyruvate isomerase family mycothiol-dependent enzyme n=1 Tax=Sinomonas notoginsengisoli TaxID=1457311 RepID=UPI001F48BC46|nr:maleylpyruvate isomerase family mycothiol-dependent enzyme [Sinomonas notoginsengisoli]